MITERFKHADYIQATVRKVLINRGELRDKKEYLEIIAPILLYEFQYLETLGLTGEDPSVLAHSISRAPNIEMKRINPVEVEKLLNLVNYLESKSQDHGNIVLVFFTHLIMNVLWTDFCLLNEISFEEVLMKMKSLIGKQIEKP